MPIKAADTLEPNGSFSIANAKDVQVDIQTEGQRLDDYLANLQLQQGEKGDKGDPGEKGEKGEKGDKGDPADTEALTAAYKAADEEILNQAKLYAGSTVGGAAGSVLQEAKAYTDQKVVDLATGEHTHAVVTSTENGFMSPALLAQLNTATADIKTVTTTANAAKTAAATAQTTANTAKTNAATAQTTADNAKTAAATAQTTADTAKTNAATAQTTADNAKTAAATAQTTANAAKTAAATAQTTANTAKTNAATAQTTANNALTKANEALTSIANEVNHDTATSYSSVTAAVSTIANTTSTGSTSKPTVSVNINESTIGIGSATTTTAFFTATNSGKLTIPSGINGKATLTVIKSSGTLTYSVSVIVSLTKNGSDLQSATATGTLGATSTATTAALSGGTFSYVKGDVFAVKLYTASSIPTGSITGMQATLSASVTTAVTYTAVNDVAANEIFANGQLMAGASNKYFAVSSKATDGEIFRARSTNALLKFTASGLLQSFNGGTNYYRANPLVLIVRLTYSDSKLTPTTLYNPLGKTVSVTRSGTGDYTVTHNLGHTNYTLVGSGHGSDNKYALYMSVVSRTSTTVNIRTSDDASLNDLTELEISFFDYKSY